MSELVDVPEPEHHTKRNPIVGVAGSFTAKPGWSDLPDRNGRLPVVTAA